MSLATTIQKYNEERDKRLRADGPAQFTSIQSLGPELASDPFVNYQELNRKKLPFQNGGKIGALIIGAGHAGLTFAVRLIESGAFSAEDIVIVDKAGGYGGTWWYNRYPGVMCDIESYVYVPLLDETGYMPRQKYSFGHEIREHAERIAAHWGLRGLFATAVTDMSWDEDEGRWDVKMTQNRGPDAEARELSVSAQFALFAGGIYTDPKIPKLPGLDGFARSPGKRAFHTARWDYGATGGSQEDPALTKLRDKRVAIIGTGATAIQVVPHVAQWAKHLYVIQRTPSHCAERANRPTDKEAWSAAVAYGRGWQRARQDNFDCFVHNDPQAVDLVDDGWTKMPAFAGFTGHPRKVVPPEGIQEHVASLLALDQPNAERLRARVDSVVEDKRTAEKLKAWYPAWCKRPTFHDDYLPTFNRDNVTLVDTDGKGVERIIAADGTIVTGDGQEVRGVDVLILSTGFDIGAGPKGSPTERGHMDVRGRGGRSLGEKWVARDFANLHGVATNGFPNLFFFAFAGGPSSPNLTSCYSAVGTHVAAIVAAAKEEAKMKRGAEGKGGEGNGEGKVVVEVRKEAEDGWMEEVVKRAGWFAVHGVCTPGYFNAEGKMAEKPKSAEDAVLKARNAAWGQGTGHWQRVVEAYRAEDVLGGVEVRV